jgi:hypothetical protein
MNYSTRAVWIKNRRNRFTGLFMKLYQIHCGFYDEEVSDGIYEFHVNIPIVAENTDEAKRKVRAVPSFVSKKMHIDGIQEIRSVDGFDIILLKKATSDKEEIQNIRHRDL